MGKHRRGADGERVYRCCSCGEFQPASGFYWYQPGDGGARARQSECNDCRAFIGKLNRAKREHWEGRVRAYLERALRSGATVEHWQLVEVFGDGDECTRLAREWGLEHALRSEKFWTLKGQAPDVSWRGLAWGSNKWGV